MPKRTRLRRPDRHRRSYSSSYYRKVTDELRSQLNFTRGCLAQVNSEVDKRANSIASELMRTRYLDLIVEEMAREVSRLDYRRIWEWIANNRALCKRHGIHDVETAKRFLSYRAEDLRQRPQLEVRSVSALEPIEMRTLEITLPAIRQCVTIREGL